MTKTPRILMVAPQCYPPAGAEAIVTAKLLLAFLDAGWEVDVIGQTEAGQFYPTDPNGAWAPLQKLVNNVDAFFVGYIGKGDGFLKHFLLRMQSLTWALRAALVVKRMASQKRYDVIMSRVAPQYGHIPVIVCSLFSALPWIANWSDPMPSQKGPPPYGNGPDAPVSWIMRRYLAYVVRNADWHTFPNERLRRYMCSYLPGLEAKSSVIPHVALERFVAKKVIDTSVFSLCHIGGLGVRKPDVFLAGVKLFLERMKVHTSVSVRFVGLGMEEIEGEVIDLGLQDIVILDDAKTYDEAQETAAASTVLVVIEATCVEGIFLPSKFVDFVQTGRPILAVSPQIGVLVDILSKSGGGLAVNCESVEAVAEALDKFHSAWIEGKIDELYSSSRLMKQFSEKVVLEQYGSIFRYLQFCSSPSSFNDHKRSGTDVV